jgi:L-fuconolactonase
VRIDGHQHFWRASRGDYHWMNESVGILCRDYMPEDLHPILARHRIDRTVLVQAAQTVAETDFLLELAAQYEFIAGVVGWLDMDSPEFAQQFARYRMNPKFIGLRPMLQDIPDLSWILRPQVLRSLQIVADDDFPFEFLTYTRHLPFVLEALDKVPLRRAVIDHISKPEIAKRMIEPWRSLMAELADRGLYCKLSGMATEDDRHNWSAQSLRPYIQHAVDCFGWDRIIFGSDWPVCLLAGSYDEVVSALTAALGNQMEDDAERNLFGENAKKFYKLTS